MPARSSSVLSRLNDMRVHNTNGGIAARCVRSLAAAFVVSLLLAAAIVVALTTTQGESIGEAAYATAAWQFRSLPHPAAHADSWHAMHAAHSRHTRDSTEPLYRVFLEDGIKFQYPPTALLFFDLFPDKLTHSPNAVADGSPLRLALDALSRGALILTLLFSALAVRSAIQSFAGGQALTPIHNVAIFCLVFAIGLTYYPLIRAYQLGQIQVFLNCFIALAVWMLVIGRSFAAGICIGLTCLVKPQYGLVLIWAGLNKDWHMMLGMSVAVVALLIPSIAKFGFDNHFDYFQVLQYIARHGESYWANQSINGFMNRSLGNGSATTFDNDAFPPYHFLVHAVTMTSSVALVVAALWPRAAMPTDWRERLSGFALILTVATIASPIAWEHHYGALFPILLITVPGLIERRPVGRFGLAIWVFAYCAVAGIVLRTQLIHGKPGINLLGSHILIGGLTLFVLLYLLKRSYLRDSNL